MKTLDGVKRLCVVAMIVTDIIVAIDPEVNSSPPNTESTALFWRMTAISSLM